MSKPLTWPQWLNVIARNITIERPYICCHIDGDYICCHIDGDYIEGLYIPYPSKSYLDAVQSPDYASFRAKLETIIREELRVLNLADPTITTLSLKLGFPREDGVQGRQDWLRSLKD